jgi:penicillin-binding protein 2
VETATPACRSSLAQQLFRRRRILNNYEAIKDLWEEKRAFTRRAIVAAVGSLLLLLVVVARMVQLQLVEHDYFRTRADDNRMRLVAVPPARGLIYDRNGVPLAQNMPSFELQIIPEQAKGLEQTLANLSQLVRLDPQDLTRFRERLHKTPRFRPVSLRSNLTAEEVARYQLNRYDFRGRGVEIDAGRVRTYPLGAEFSHVVGYVGGITEADYATIDENLYDGLNQIGKSGIEKSYEDILRGTPGTKIIEANAAGRQLREIDPKPGTPGRDLYLTIDAKLQEVAENALGPLDGAAVAIDPRTGEVLALVSKPGFDPKAFVEGIDNASYQALLADPDRTLFNRALLGTYPPGSTIKPFIAIAGLISGTLDPEKQIFDPGYFQLPGVDRKYRCYKCSGHGWVALSSALAKSCDVYFYQAALDLGIDRIDNILAGFGFGRASGLDIPSERSGLLPNREWKRRIYRQAWFPGETINVGIGQGYLTVTPIELAQATARLAMRGGGFKPHMVHAIGDPATHSIVASAVETLPAIDTRDQASFDRVIAAMQMVTQDPGGTAYAVFKDAPYTVAGKTGTAQVTGLKQDETYAPRIDTVPHQFRDHALFMAFAPVDAPRIAIAVVAEHAGHGGTSAAPVARAMMDQYLLGKVLYKVPDAIAPAEPEPPPDDSQPDEPAAPVLPPQAGAVPTKAAGQEIRH